jgi:hypothetical protein
LEAFFGDVLETSWLRVWRRLGDDRVGRGWSLRLSSEVTQGVQMRFLVHWESKTDRGGLEVRNDAQVLDSP